MRQYLAAPRTKDSQPFGACGSVSDIEGIIASDGEAVRRGGVGYLPDKSAVLVIDFHPLVAAIGDVQSAATPLVPSSMSSLPSRVNFRTWWSSRLVI